MRPRITISRPLIRRIAITTVVAAGIVTTLFVLMPLGGLLEENFTRIKVFYGTDRLPARRDGRLTQYAGNWSEVLQYGMAEVSLPRDHQVGVVESPSVWRLEFRADPEKHVHVHSAEPVTGQEFARRMREAVGRSAGKEILLFVHGFNVSFEEALKRTAQIFYDLELPGVPVTYAWPSQAKLGPVAYVADGNMADVTVPHLKSFLVELAHQNGARRIHVIAHSMGNKILARSFDAIVADTTVRPMPRFNHIALTAPDIDERVITDIAARVYPLAQRITMYASDNDSALQLASEYTRSRRAGQAGANILIVPHIDTVDASNVDTSLVGHSYYGSNRSVLSDIYYVVRFNQSPDNRFLLRRIDVPRGRYWQFKP